MSTTRAQGAGSPLSAQRGWWVRSAKVVTPSAPDPGGRLHVAHRDGRLCDAVRGLVDRAEQVVVLGSFLLAYRELLESIRAAARRGVRVYILTASEKHLDRDPDGEVEADRITEHRELLDALAEVALLRSAPGFHAKVILIDPHTRPRGLLLTANLVHSDLTINDEAAVELTRDEVTDCFATLRYAFWELAEHELREPGLLQAVSPAGVAAPPVLGGKLLLTTAASDGISERLVERIGRVSQVVLSNFTFHADHPVVAALCAAAEVGKEVTVLVRPSERTARSLPAHLALLRSGAVVRGTDRMHAKLVSFGGTRAILHSSNLASYPDTSVFELGVEVHGARARAVDDVLRTWAAFAPWTLCDELQGERTAVRIVHVGDGRWDELPRRDRPKDRPMDRPGADTRGWSV